MIFPSALVCQQCQGEHFLCHGETESGYNKTATLSINACAEIIIPKSGLKYRSRAEDILRIPDDVEDDDDNWVSKHLTGCFDILHYEVQRTPLNRATSEQSL